MGGGENCDAVLGDCGSFCFDWRVLGGARRNYLEGWWARMRKHKSDRIIGALTLVLLGVGLIMIYAIGPMRANVLNAAYGAEVGENSSLFIR